MEKSFLHLLVPEKEGNASVGKTGCTGVAGQLTAGTTSLAIDGRTGVLGSALVRIGPC